MKGRGSKKGSTQSPWSAVLMKITMSASSQRVFMIDIIIDDSNHCIGECERGVGSGESLSSGVVGGASELCSEGEDGAFGHLL